MARAKWKRLHKSLTLRSGFEKRVATYLDEKNISYEYETTIVPYIVPESKHKYIPDYKLSNGILIEVKGNFDAKSRQKMAYVIEQNPELDIRMLFMSDNKISKSSKTRYSDWCDKRQIPYHVSSNGTIPDAWLIENPERPVRESKENKKQCQKKSLSSRAKSTQQPSLSLQSGDHLK